MPAEEPASERRLPIGLMVVGSEMVSFTVVGLLLDYGLGTMPGFTIGLTLLGLGASFFHLVKMSKALSAKKPPPPPAPPSEESRS
jgi:F0F1-type ATP synthase assembly protein I